MHNCYLSLYRLNNATLKNIVIDGDTGVDHGILIRNCRNVSIYPTRIFVPMPSDATTYGINCQNSTDIIINGGYIQAVRGAYIGNQSITSPENQAGSQIQFIGCTIRSNGVGAYITQDSTAWYRNCRFLLGGADYAIDLNRAYPGSAGSIAYIDGCQSDTATAFYVQADCALYHSGTRNMGLEASGATSVADGGTIAHGMTITPREATARGSLAGTSCAVTALGPTTITVDLIGTTTTQTVYWHAKY